MELKIEPKDNTLLLGPSYIELKDKSDHTYLSNNLQDFLKYLKEGMIVFVSETEIQAFDKEQLQSPYFNMSPRARYQILLHPILLLLKTLNNKAQDLTTLTNNLQSLRKYLIGDCLALVDISRNLKIMKIVTIEQEKDKRGNFVFTFRSEKGRQDFEFPETLKFGTPLLNDNTGRIELEFEFQFDWNFNSDGNAQLQFRMLNLEINILIRDEVDKILNKIFDELKIQKYSGNLVVRNLTDETMYNITPLSL